MALDRARLVSYTQVDGEGCSLRRRRNLVFPVFLLALLAQIFAPGVAGFAVHADGFSSAQGCSITAGGAASKQQTPPSPHRHSDQCCLFCHVPQAVDPASAVTSFAVPAPAARIAAWVSIPAVLAPAPAAKHARARAPPSFS